MGAGDIHPKGDKLRQAVRWLCDGGDYSARSIQDAACRFDLSPADEEFLLAHFRDADSAAETIEPHDDQ